MKQITLPTYADLSRVLSHTTLKLHPSQVHGLICGVITGNLAGTAMWEELVTGGEKEDGETHELLQSLYDSSARQLDEFLFELQLIMPSDKEPLPERAEALTVWCQGFLTGLKVAGIPIVKREPAEVTEAINDLVEIAKMKFEEVVASEEDETAYVELVEFVRMAVVLIYQDLREGDVSKRKAHSSGHLH